MTDQQVAPQDRPELLDRLLDKLGESNRVTPTTHPQDRPEPTPQGGERFVFCEWSCSKCKKQGTSNVFAYGREAPKQTAGRFARQTASACVAGCLFRAKPACREVAVPARAHHQQKEREMHDEDSAARGHVGRISRDIYAPWGYADDILQAPARAHQEEKGKDDQSRVGPSVPCVGGLELPQSGHEASPSLPSGRTERE